MSRLPGVDGQLPAVTSIVFAPDLDTQWPASLLFSSTFGVMENENLERCLTMITVDKVVFHLYQERRRHPLLQGTYTGVRTTILGNLFFPPFLTKTKRE